MALVAFLLAIYMWTATAELQGSTTVHKPPPEFDHGIDLPTRRPLNIAHRGSCGSLPEHSLAAYQRAIDEGADVIECDLAVSRDLVLWCMHENWMNATTNVRFVFPDRSNSYYIPDSLRTVTDYFAVDFVEEEMLQIRRRQQNSARDPNYDDLFRIATFDEFVNIAKHAGRPVGLHIETKDPEFVNSLSFVVEADTTLEDLLLDSLIRFGYNVTDPRNPVFLQSFNENSLRYMYDKGVRLPMVLLLALPISDARLEQLSQWCYGIGPDKRLIIQTNLKNQIIGRTNLTERAHAVGLRLHPYTLRNEHEYLAWDYKQDPLLEHEDFFDLGVDGVFTDFPGTYSNFLSQKYDCIQSLAESKSGQHTDRQR